jgi:hypothetical protein
MHRLHPRGLELSMSMVQIGQCNVLYTYVHINICLAGQISSETKAAPWPDVGEHFPCGAHTWLLNST